MKNNIDFKYANVIVTFNRSKLLIETIESILKQTIATTKIIVINNASTDDTLQQLNSYFDLTDDRFIIETLPENRGGSFGFYTGLKIASKLDVDWISVSDDDAIFDSNYFEEIYKGIQKYNDVQLFAGSVWLENDKIQVNHRRRLVDSVTMRQKEVSVSEYKSDFKFDTCTFVGAVFNKKLVEKIGLPEKGFFIWFDDTEYTLRAIKYTKAINICDAKILHKTEVQSSNNSYAPNWREYYGVRNEIITNFRHTKSKLILFIFICYQFLKKTISIIVHMNNKGYKMFELLIRWRGTFDGFRKKSGKSKIYFPGMKYKK